MGRKKQRIAGVVMYWVVARDVRTTELMGSKSFVTMKEANLYKIGYAETRDPPGHVTEVTIEVLPTHELPKKFLK